MHPNIDKKISFIFDNIAKSSLKHENYRTSIRPEKLKDIIAQNNEKPRKARDRLKKLKQQEIINAKNCLKNEGRVLSVKELSLIMGFREGLSFPKIVNEKNQEIEIPVNERYQMLVDSVSPKFSVALAATIKKIL
jgi:site-specific DNA-cytosine methylase